MMEFLQKFPCACCGYKVNEQPPGYHERCPICGWEDDLSQLRFADMTGVSNHVTLVTGQKNFIQYGAAERRNISVARAPVPGEQRDDRWRPIDENKDNIEHPQSGINYAESYPRDPTVLYYWRETYWRRYTS